MTTFRYSAYDPRGEFAAGAIEAASEDVATDMLWAQGLTPFKLRPVDQHGKRWWERELFASANARPTDLAGFTREFETLTTAEIPLDDALRILGDQAASPRMRTLATSLLDDVLNGSTLSDAMSRQPRIFPADYVSVVRAGEIGGAIGDVFSELADLLERRLEVRSRIQSALVYPMLLITLAFVALAIVLGVLIPSIAPVFAGSGRPMPAAIAFALTVQSRWPEILAGMVCSASAAIGATLVAIRRQRVRLLIDRRLLKAPLFGAFILQHETARFSRTLGTLLRAGVPLLQATTTASTVIGNRHLALGMNGALDSIREGMSLHRALRDATALPAIALRMVTIGEEAGKLDRMLLRVAAMLEQQTQRSTERFMTILTPLLTVMMASLVGGIVMAVMDAILSMNDVEFR